MAARLFTAIGQLVGRFVARLAGDPQSATPSDTNASAERRLALRLDTELPDAAVVLHGRKVPSTRGNVDHLALTPSGIWLIDVTHYPGTIERRNVGPPWSRRVRLYIDNEDHQHLATGMRWQITSLRAQLDTIGSGDTPIRAVLCFAGSTWRRHATPFEIGDVLVTSPTTLIAALSTDGPLNGATIDLLARHLETNLPATTAGAGPARG